jgi:hypothetical protein
MAFGPLFAEQPDFELHKPFRDRAAAIETDLARSLKEAGAEVLGTHPRPQPLSASDQHTVDHIFAELAGYLGDSVSTGK